MPVRHQVDSKKRVVFTWVEGPLSNVDLLGMRAGIQALPDFDPEYDQLVDVRGITDVSATSAAIRDYARKPRAFNESSRIAIVANRDLLVGMANMYIISRDSEHETTRLFETEEEARAWLGLDQDL